MKTPSIYGLCAIASLILCLFSVCISCSKDVDVLRAAVSENGTMPIPEQDSTNTVEPDGEVANDSILVNTTNEPPIAIISANTLSGIAPLSIEFAGSNSYDDKGIVGYQWQFDTSTATDSIAIHEFKDPGSYDISLTVYDDEGLESTATVAILINAAETTDTANISCEVGGAKANITGSKIWCWANIDIPDYSGSTGVGFSNGELHIDSECYEKQITTNGNELKFNLNPLTPVENWCSRDFNMRAEIRTAPWDVHHDIGTEEWFGWSYRFGNEYTIDQKSQWKFFQVHPGIMGISPQIGMEVINDSQFNGHNAGEVYVTNATIAENYTPTGITPNAGDILNIVVHVIWGDSSNGLLQVWINDQMVYDKAVSTVYENYPWGGNAKWGIYKWPWANNAAVQESLQQGITHLETYMGSLRMLTRRPGDEAYLSDAYDLVVPN